MIKRLHFLPWSPYFTHRIVKKISLLKEGDEFIVWRPKEYTQSTTSIFNILQLNKYLNNKCNHETRFITHSLCVPVAFLLSRNKWKSNHISWITWGAEYNSLVPFLKFNRINNSSLIHRLKSTIKLRAIKSFDKIISTPGEIDLFRKLITADAKYIPYHSYLSVADIRPVSRQKTNSLLLGNSNDVSNNHLEALEWLELNNYKGKIIIPLPDVNCRYAKEILISTKKKSNTVSTVSTSISSADFNELIGICEYALMYQKRQQAMITIYTLLWQGTKIFLREENPLVELLKKWSIHFTIIDQGNQDYWVPLTIKEAIHNKAIIENKLSDNSISEQYKLMLN